LQAERRSIFAMAAAATHEGSTTGAAQASPDVGYPNGHLGHLTDDETKALAEFKALITEKGAYSPGPPPSHDDQTLLYVLADYANLPLSMTSEAAES
jgi:hypothetical protein